MTSLYTQMMNAVTKEEKLMALIDHNLNCKPGSTMLAGGQAAISPPIEQAVKRLDNEIALLDEGLEALYQRLAPYLTQTNPSGASAYPPQPIMGSSVAVMKVSDLAERLSRICCTLAAIKERLEL